MKISFGEIFQRNVLTLRVYVFSFKENLSKTNLKKKISDIMNSYDIQKKESVIPFKVNMRYMCHSKNLKVKNIHNKELDILGVLFTQYDARRNLDKSVVKALKNESIPTFETIINRSVELSEAPAHSKSIFEYYPDGRGAKEYLKFSKEVIEWLNQK